MVGYKNGSFVSQGMGEPLSNYEAVKAAVGMMGHSRLFGIGARHITVSTVGVIPRIKQMAADLPVGPRAACSCRWHKLLTLACQ
jgi:adenine C2-methylase RlmN of 23S rRNA A2503 and tRNA A37